jgi:hypothetical protein
VRADPLGDLVDVFGDLVCLLDGWSAREQEKELVPADARHDVTLAQTRVEPRRHLFQELVAGGVSERVVHQLEPVQIERPDHDGLPRAAGLREGDPEVLLEEGTVGKLRDGVVVGEELQLRMRVSELLDGRAFARERCRQPAPDGLARLETRHHPRDPLADEDAGGHDDECGRERRTEVIGDREEWVAVGHGRQRREEQRAPRPVRQADPRVHDHVEHGVVVGLGAAVDIGDGDHHERDGREEERAPRRPSPPWRDPREDADQQRDDADADRDDTRPADGSDHRRDEREEARPEEQSRRQSHDDLAPHGDRIGRGRADAATCRGSEQGHDHTSLPAAIRLP